VELRPPEQRQLVLEDDQLRRLVPLPLRHPLVDDGHLKVRLQVTPPSGSPDTTFAVASVVAPSGSVRRHPAEEGKRSLDGVENRDHVEAREV